MTAEMEPAAGTAGGVADDPEDTVRKHMMIAMGAGLIPLPIVDMAVLTWVQLQFALAAGEALQGRLSRASAGDP